MKLDKTKMSWIGWEPQESETSYLLRLSMERKEKADASENVQVVRILIQGDRELDNNTRLRHIQIFSLSLRLISSSLSQKFFFPLLKWHSQRTREKWLHVMNIKTAGTLTTFRFIFGSTGIFDGTKSRQALVWRQRTRDHTYITIRHKKAIHVDSSSRVLGGNPRSSHQEELDLSWVNC